MRLLLDTHIAVWAALDPEALTKSERGMMAGADAPLVLSAVAVCVGIAAEMAQLPHLGSAKGPVDPVAVVAIAAAMEWELLPLTARYAAAALTQAVGHKDPFYELLLVQAQEGGMRLITRDAKRPGIRWLRRDGWSITAHRLKTALD